MDANRVKRNQMLAQRVIKGLESEIWKATTQSRRKRLLRRRWS